MIAPFNDIISKSERHSSISEKSPNLRAKNDRIVQYFWSHSPQTHSPEMASDERQKKSVGKILFEKDLPQ